MANTLSERVLDPTKRALVVDDSVALIDAQVASKGGIKGVALKGAYKIVKAIKPGFVRSVADGLLDEFVGKLEPRYAAYLSDPTAPTFGAALPPHAHQIADELLQVTDDKAQTSPNQTVVKLYRKLRPTAQEHVAQAVPALGALIDRHLT